MKIIKRLLPVLFSLLLVLALSMLCSCSRTDSSDAEEVIKSELDLLKNLDSDTTQKYISYTEMFPDATENTKLSDEIQNVFSLFFQQFDYKILDVSVDEDKKNAQASLELTTIDAKSLATDFAAELLRTKITEAAQAKAGNIKDSSKSLEGHYLILNQLLTNNKYDSAVTDSTIQLTNKGDGKKEKWEIRRNYSLENDLVGGLMTYLSDSDLLSPEETLTVYLNTLKTMDLDQMGNYLGIESLMNTDDSDKNSIAAALVEQVHDHFDFKITDCKIHGYQASLSTEITTFDSSAVLAAYQAQQDTYLASPEAVIDGSSKRYEKSLDLLLENIKNNTATRTATATFHLTNDGVSWKLQDSNSSVGSAIFGTLSITPVAEESDTDTEE